MGRQLEFARWIVCLALAFAGALVAQPADSCAVLGFREHRRPSLAYEQVLLLFDEKNEIEHFVRSISFRAEDHPFGFVVPTMLSLVSRRAAEGPRRVNPSSRSPSTTPAWSFSSAGSSTFGLPRSVALGDSGEQND